jgi:hypothetical protein
MGVRTLTFFSIGSHVVIEPWARRIYGTVVKVGRKYVTVAFEGGGSARVHPAMLRLWVR